MTPDDAGGIESPCVRNCCLDEANVCIGCGRELDEIVGWSSASDDEKRAIRARSRARVERRRSRTNWP